MVEHFTSILSCHFSFITDSKPEPCTLVIDITKEMLNIKILYSYYGEPKSIDFKYDEYNKLLVYKLGCVFMNDSNTEKNVYFYFFNNENDIKRFIFILTDSGMIVPQSIDQTDQTQFEFLSHHSFVPKGNYTFTLPLIITNIKKILKNRVKKIKADDVIPSNDAFYSKIYPFLHKIEERKIKKLKIANKNKISGSFKSPDQSTLIIKMVAKVRAHKNEYKRLFQEMKKNRENEKFSKYFQMIESDFQRMNSTEILSSIYTEKLTKTIGLICMNVCKVYIFSQKVEYFQNNFFIALKLALLLIGGDRIKNFVDCTFYGNSKRELKSLFQLIPSDVIKITENEFEYESLVYSLYSYLMKSLSANVSDLMSNSFQFFVSYLEYLVPYSGALFVLTKIKSFNFLEKMVENLFLFSFKSPWIAWLFIMRTNDRELAVESIVASIIYHLVPRIVSEKIDSEMSIERFLPNFEQELQNDSNLVKEIVDVATCFYFYQKPESENPSFI